MSTGQASSLDTVVDVRGTGAARSGRMTGAELAQRSSPSLVLHPEDAWKPIDAAALIAACELRFADSRGERLVAATGAVEPALLGSGAGAGAYSEPAAELGESLRAWQLTRPFEKQTARQ